MLRRPSRIRVALLATIMLAVPALWAVEAEASSPFIGQIIMFGGNFAPNGYAFCDGQLLNISSFTALFSILGTTYGGDGETTFALPDLRGRVAVHEGTGPGLTNWPLGQKSGAQSVFLSVNQLPSHTHSATGTLMATDADGDNTSPTGHVLANDPREDQYANAAPNVLMRANSLSITVGNTGGNQGVSIMQPYLVVNYLIALTGTFPSSF